MTGKELQAARVLLGMTQPQLAERVGVRPNSVYRWEAGIHKIPRSVEIVVQQMITEKMQRK